MKESQISSNWINISIEQDTCWICGMKLEGWIYYQHNNAKICHFCWNSFEKKGDDD